MIKFKIEVDCPYCPEPQDNGRQVGDPYYEQNHCNYCGCNRVLEVEVEYNEVLEEIIGLDADGQEVEFDDISFYDQTRAWERCEIASGAVCPECSGETRKPYHCNCTEVL